MNAERAGLNAEPTAAPMSLISAPSPSSLPLFLPPYLVLSAALSLSSVSPCPSLLSSLLLSFLASSLLRQPFPLSRHSSLLTSLPTSLGPSLIN